MSTDFFKISIYWLEKLIKPVSSLDSASLLLYIHDFKLTLTSSLPLFNVLFWSKLQSLAKAFTFSVFQKRSSESPNLSPQEVYFIFTFDKEQFAIYTIKRFVYINYKHHGIFRSYMKVFYSPSNCQNSINGTYPLFLEAELNRV